MDRRTLLAFLLATVVLVVYQLIAPPPGDRNPPRSEPADAAVTRESTQSAPFADTAARNGTALPAPEAAPVTAGGWPTPPRSLQRTDVVKTEVVLQSVEAVTIANADMAIQISPLGATPTQWSLSRWTDAREQEVRLVSRQNARLFEMAIVDDGSRIEFPDIQFEQQPSVDGQARFAATGPDGQRIALDYRLDDTYQVALEVTLTGFENPDGERSLEIVFPRGIPSQEKISKQDEQSAAAMAMVGNRLVKHLHHGKKAGWAEEEEGVVRWIGMRSKYFLVSIVPAQSPDAQVSFRRERGEPDLSATLLLPLGLSGESRFSFGLYGGPMEYRRLEGLGVNLEKAVDLGWSIFLPLTRLLLRFFQWMHGAVPNYGVVIVILSVMVKLIFYPLTKASLNSMKQMQALKPEMDRLAEKYKDEPEKRNKSTLELYQKHKVNPVSGCLPILIQIPVFGALYNVFNTAIELRKAPFGLWIQDLSAPDKVGAILGFPLHVLPLLLAATAIIQQKLTPTDPRQAALMYLLPVITTVFFYTLPSGLVLYWTVTNVLQIGQQILVNRSSAPLAKAA